MSSNAKSQHCTVLAADTIYIGDGQRPDCSSIVLMMRTVRNQQCRQKLMFDFSLFCFSPVQQYINTKEQKKLCWSYKQTNDLFDKDSSILEINTAANGKVLLLSQGMR